MSYCIETCLWLTSKCLFVLLSFGLIDIHSKFLNTDIIDARQDIMLKLFVKTIRNLPGLCHIKRLNYIRFPLKKHNWNIPFHVEILKRFTIIRNMSMHLHKSNKKFYLFLNQIPLLKTTIILPSNCLKHFLYSAKVWNCI